MGLFDKKYCDICGEKIGLLGNRKLEDGNLCKNCANKLSPFFNERRHSTVEDIKKQLEYRQENAKLLVNFHPDIKFGENTKVYVDRNNRQFIVTSALNWQKENPDLISLNNIKGINTNIQENKREIYYKDADGNRKSYMPPRYECNYAFNVVINVDSPWFDTIEIELSEGNRPDSPYTDLYRHYEQQMHSLTSVLNQKDNMQNENNYQRQTDTSSTSTREQELINEVLKDSSWLCKQCSTANSGTLYCQNCGAPFSDENVLSMAKNIAKAKIMMEETEKNNSHKHYCPSCGSEINDGDSIVKFCPNCGTSLKD